MIKQKILRVLYDTQHIQIARGNSDRKCSGLHQMLMCKIGYYVLRYTKAIVSGTWTIEYKQDFSFETNSLVHLRIEGSLKQIL